MADYTRRGVSLATRSYNGRELLEECLPSILEAAAFHGHPDNEVCVADDGSGDGTAEMMRVKFPQVRFFRLERRSGSPIASNTAIAQCKNEIIIFMDNDVKVERDFIAPALPHFNDPSVFAVTMRARRFDKTTFQSGGQVGRFSRGFIRAWENYDVPDPEHPLVTERQLYSLYGITAHVAFRKSMFTQLGGFDPLYSPYIWEDTDLGYRAWKRGWKTVYEPRCLVYHKVHGTAAKLPASSRMLYVSERNRLIFHWKLLADGDLLFWHFFFLFWRTLLALITFKKKFLLALAEALQSVPAIRAGRKAEKPHWVLRDRDILAKPLETLKKLGENK